jgi:hypothetical protein
LATDELFAMVQGAQHPQDVMKMTQIIWYRSQVAPRASAGRSIAFQASWENTQPDAKFITIAPVHLREAFWTKISRPVKGIMYHGWQSLVPTSKHASYRHTHAETRHVLAHLIREIVEPLGPMLVQIPAAKTDVALLESFTSQMFAGRGTYGWANGWTADAWHILKYAQLQPEVVYEQQGLRDGLESYRVLVLPSCDVLTESIVKRIKAFQQRGGILVGDERLTPAIQPDITMRIHKRSTKADEDKRQLLAIAAELRTALDDSYQRYVDSSNAEVTTHYRRYGSTDYVFAINDCREFGDYVGHHGLVMERGLPAKSTLTIRRKCGHIYDLTARRKVTGQRWADGTMSLPLVLGPGAGAVYLVSELPIERVSVSVDESASRGEQVSVAVAITDANARPIDAVVPVHIVITDPDGRPAEFSGYYGAADGRVDLTLDTAPNDTLGVWEIRVQELASGIVSRAFFRLGPDKELH